MPKRRKMIKSSIDSLLLCLISSQPMYGYQIIKELKSRSQGYFKFKEGTVYPVLHKLEESGLIEGKWQETFTYRQGKYYYITDKGFATIAEKRSSWNEFSTAMKLIIGEIKSRRLAHIKEEKNS